MYSVLLLPLTHPPTRLALHKVTPTQDNAAAHLCDPRSAPVLTVQQLTLTCRIHTQVVYQHYIERTSPTLDVSGCLINRCAFVGHTPGWCRWWFVGGERDAVSGGWEGSGSWCRRPRPPILPSTQWWSQSLLLPLSVVNDERCSLIRKKWNPPWAAANFQWVSSGSPHPIPPPPHTLPPPGSRPTPTHTPHPIICTWESVELFFIIIYSIEFLNFSGEQCELFDK